MRRASQALVCAALAAGLLSSPAVAAGTQLSEGDVGSALEAFGACVAAQHGGDLLLLLDQSGSLTRTDPHGQRVVAATYLLQQLRSAVAKSGVAMDVSIAGFDATYQQAASWQRLDNQSLPGLEQTVASFRGRNHGIDTDYWNALDGVRRSLRAKAAGQDRCQAVVWLTDGAYDVQARLSKQLRKAYPDRKPYAPKADLGTKDGAAAALRAGLVALCTPRGLSDQLRSSGVKVLAVGLQATAAAGDFAFIRGVATGVQGPGAPSCGAPTSEAVGDFRLATNLDDVLFAFGELADPTHPPADRRGGVCPVRACAAHAHRFVLDDSISTVKVLAGADDDGIVVELRAPGGGLARFDHGRLPQQGAFAIGADRGQFAWLSGRTLSLTVQRGPSAAWTGPWSVTFIDPTGKRTGAVSRTQIRIEGDLVPVWPGQSQVSLRSGTVVRGLRFGVLGESDKRVVNPKALLGHGELSVALQGVDGGSKPVETVAVADAAKAVDLDLRGVAPGAGVMRLRLALTTADYSPGVGRPTIPGTRLADRVVDLHVEVLPPFHYPVPRGKINFGHFTGSDPRHASLVVDGPGCVWLQRANVTAVPDGSRDATLTSTANSKSSCLKIAEGQTTSLLVSLQLKANGNGTVGGSAVLGLAPPDAQGTAVEQPVDFSGDAEKPVKTGLVILAFSLALLLGLGLPALFLYGFLLWTGRIPPVGLLAGFIPVSVEAARVLRNGAPFTAGNGDVDPVPVTAKRGREVALGEGAKLCARLSPVPGEGSYVTLDAPGRVSVAGRAPHSTKDGRRARLPLAVHNTWSLVVDEATGSTQVLLLASSTATTDVLDALAAEVQREAPALLTRLRSLLPATAQAGAAGESEKWFSSGDPVRPPADSWFGGGTPAQPLGGAAPPPPSPPAAPPPADPSTDGWFSGGPA